MTAVTSQDRLRAVVEASLLGPASVVAALGELTVADMDPPSVDLTTIPAAAVVCRGRGVSPGVVRGRIALSTSQTLALAERGESVVLLTELTGPADLPAVLAANAIILCRGGNSSHAAVVARGTAAPCVVAVGGRIDDVQRRYLTTRGTAVDEGAEVVVDGSTGLVWMPSSESGDVPAFGGPDLVAQVARLAAGRGRIGVYVNADTADAAAAGCDNGALGVGLVRTEQQFTGDDASLLRRALLAPRGSFGYGWRPALLAHQRACFTSLLHAARGGPVTVRLLDPPLADVLEAAAIGANPALGARGARIGILRPDLYDLQVRALVEASVSVANGAAVQVLVPMVTTAAEFRSVSERVKAVAREVGSWTGEGVELAVGAMIETPRAALWAGSLATEADFLAIGSNDLTQSTWAVDRDDGLGLFLADYLVRGLVDRDPFVELEPGSVRFLIEHALRSARSAHPGITVGVCGEGAMDAGSFRWLKEIGIDYVSCAPSAVPRAWLMSAQGGSGSASTTTTRRAHDEAT